MAQTQDDQKAMDEIMMPVTVRLPLDQWEVVQQALQQRATALLAARDSHLLTQKDAVAMHRATWSVYGEIADQVAEGKALWDIETMDRLL